MVRQLLFPRDGGGSLRRFLGVRSRLFRDQWNDNRPLRGPVPLFDFRRRDDAADVRDALQKDRLRGLFGGWRVSDDSVIGGYSRSRMEFIEGVRPEDNGDGELGASSQQQQIAPPFLRWSGSLSTEINRQSQLARNVTRSGFAAVLSPEFPFGAPLGNKYGALEICCRTDGRTYAVNLHVETYFPDDLYQGFIVGGDGKQGTDTGDKEPPSMEMNGAEGVDGNAPDTSSGEDDNQTLERPEDSLDVRTHLQNRRNFIQRRDPDNHPYRGHPPLGFQRFILPFRDFVLTSRGRVRQTQRDLDGAVTVESIGFTLMDGNDGDFCLDLVSLRAVNLIEGEVVGSLEDDARDEMLEESLRPKIKKEDEEDDDEELEVGPSISKT
ncbi:hypothetical protein ACHAXT_003338 [Thalassiosira profunda]